MCARKRKMGKYFRHTKEKMDFMCVQRDIYQKKITKADQEIQRYVTTLPGKKRIDV